MDNSNKVHWATLASAFTQPHGIASCHILQAVSILTIEVMLELHCHLNETAISLKLVGAVLSWAATLAKV
jgi:hypothetical protein